MVTILKNWKGLSKVVLSLLLTSDRDVFMFGAYFPWRFCQIPHTKVRVYQAAVRTFLFSLLNGSFLNACNKPRAQAAPFLSKALSCFLLSTWASGFLLSPSYLQEVTAPCRSALDVPLPTLVMDAKGKETSVDRRPTTCQAWDILFLSLNLSAGNDHLVTDTYYNVDFSRDLLTRWMRKPSHRVASSLPDDSS